MKEALARLIWWEARGEPEAGQIAVANVVLNRVRDARWPDTVEEVIAQANQFTPYGNKRYFSVAVPDRLFAVADRAIGGEKAVPDDYFYFSVGKATRYAKDFIRIGRHYFGRDIRDGDSMMTLKLKLPRMCGEEVKVFQQLVTMQGFDCGKADGVYGPLTVKACKAFQKQEGLAADGVCGPLTWAMLQGAGETWVKRLCDWGFSAMIGLCGLTFAVKQCQSAMGLAPDGIEEENLHEALEGEIVVPRIGEAELRCQCGAYDSAKATCTGYPAGRGMGAGVLLLSERIFREAEKTYPGAQFFVSGVATDPSGRGGSWRGQIAGGYRCKKWNAVRNGSRGSKHLTGMAMDIWGRADGELDAKVRKHLEDIALRMNVFGGVGYGAAYIVHIDTRGKKARWKY